MTIYVSRWEDNSVVSVLSLFLPSQLNNDKAVYPTPQEFSLVTFPNFLKCYVFLCKLAEDVADDLQELLGKWEDSSEAWGVVTLMPSEGGLLVIRGPLPSFFTSSFLCPNG
jgi:hypothetical protein